MVSAIDENVSNVMVMAKVLSTLPVKYSPFISAWDSVPSEKQTLTSLRGRLLREEARMSALDDVTSALATMTLSKASSSAEHRLSNKLTCNFCKNRDHLERYFYAKKREKRENNSNKSQTKSENTTNPVAFVITEHRELSEKTEANILSSDIERDWFLKTDEKDFWFLDSGAFRHVCCHRESNLSSFMKKYVYLGNETRAKVEGQGKIFIKPPMA